MFRVPTLPRLAAFCALALAGSAGLAACNSGDVMRPEALVGSVSATPQDALVGPVESVDAMRTAAYMPRVENPLSVPQPDGDYDAGPRAEPYVMPGEEIACRQRLRKLGAVFRDVPSIGEGAGCGVAWPVQLTHLSKGRIALKNGATLNCHMAEAFATWVKNELVPQSRWRYFSGVESIQIASSYSCRWVKGRVGGTLSEHGKGNAIDIGSIGLNNGKEIDVRKPGFFAFREKALLKMARAEACDYFTTVLGPGYDYDHRNHFHFDLKERRNGRVACN
jgi:hypothetical protein